MTEPDLDGRGLPSASRRWLVKLGGGLLGLLLVPELALAAAKAASRSTKTARASARSATSKSAAKRWSSARSSHSSAGKVARHSRGGARSRLSKRSGRSPAVSEGASAVVVESPPSIIAPRGFTPGSRSLAFNNVHTGELRNIDYFIDGRYDWNGLREIDYVLRDYHTDETCPIDPELLNQLHELRSALGSREAFTVYSGYRSPETNEAYRRIDARVAEHSFHVKGQALDFALPGRDLRQIRAVALSMQSGGVGYYPWSGFLHLDSGPVRRW